MDALSRPLGFEERESVKVLVVVRWAVLGALVLLFDYPLRADTGAIIFVGWLVCTAGLLNLALQWLLASGRAIPLWFPLAIGVFDAAAITGGVAVSDGFDNGGYLLYYPALMGFAALFRGRVGITYCVAIMVVYTVMSVTAYEHFDRTSVSDWHDLGLRLITMMAAVLIAYLLVRVERERRERAVAAETMKQQEVLALEEQTREMERRAERERLRLTRDIHDGVSQGVYMLSLGLESAAHQMSLEGRDGKESERMEALVRLSKRTLLEARGLLFDLGSVMGGDTQLDALVHHQADEFRAVTGIAVSVTTSEMAAPLPATTVAEVYRVMQESLANIYRHSAATTVRIELRESAAGTILMVADDGIGFRPDDVQGRGHGLRTMRERSALIGAQLEVRSTPGVGTCLSLTIPPARPAAQEVENRDSRVAR